MSRSPRGFLRLPLLFVLGLFITLTPLVVLTNLIWNIQ